MPTNRWQAPSAQTVSVSDGNRLTTRCGGRVISMFWRRSSCTVMAAAAQAQQQIEAHHSDGQRLSMVLRPIGHDAVQLRHTVG